MGRIRNLWVFLGLILFAVSFCDLQVSADVMPSENECRPYIEKAIHELKNTETETESTANEVESTESKQDENDSVEESPNPPAPETTESDGGSVEDTTETQSNEDDTQSQENQTDENNSVEAPKEEVSEEDTKSTENDESSQEANESEQEQEQVDGDLKEDEEQQQQQEESQEEQANSEVVNEVESTESEQVDESVEKSQDENVTESAEQVNNNESDEEKTQEESVEENNATEEAKEEGEEAIEESKEDENAENTSDDTQSVEEVVEEESVRTKRSIQEEEIQVEETQEDVNESQENSTAESAEEEVKNDSKDNENETTEEMSKEDETTVGENVEEESGEVKESAEETKSSEDENATNEEESKEVETEEAAAAVDEPSNETAEESVEEEIASAEEQQMDVEDLTLEFEIPKNLRSHEHVDSLLGLNGEAVIKETALRKTGDVILKELKKVYDNAIKPLEGLYKYRELSNRHFGDPEIFSKPLVLFMGPWSGGKSTILNYLTENEYTPNSIRSGAEPSPAHFNILMHGDEPEVLDGTQLAADWTFSGLQKFGQGLMDRLRGQKLPNKLLERVNIVEIPGILEVRKQVSRYFPFNDACQWFIDRADIIFLVYDPSKLDVGPETEAILDQLKGREYQTRILLNKADQVKPEELLRVQGALIWNISPLMSSAQPPVMYTVSLWSHPYENGAPTRLLQAQEKAFLTDLREAIDKRIENKIASARRFAVRIRNHAKMVDCYLTTYYNQKGLFSNKKSVADKIIENPQNYNIYEGLSTLTNISRYDLPDPEVYLDFFRLNPLYEFKKLSETCTYFKGCPINKLDIAIAYDLPELVGKYKKSFEQNLSQLRKEYDENCNQTEIEPPVKINTR